MSFPTENEITMTYHQKCPRNQATEILEGNIVFPENPLFITDIVNNILFYGYIYSSSTKSWTYS